VSSPGRTLTFAIDLLNPNVDALEDSDSSPTLDALTSRRSLEKNKNAEQIHAAADAVSSENASTSVMAPEIDAVGGGAAELEEEAAGEGAFNPETGEINWDCPCLGGMAHGPCGPQFREAFSCFIFSTEEPKGMDCIEKFQGMRDCFQEHPDVYKDELIEDEEIEKEVEAERQELAQQIAERQKADQQSGRRLLEEPVPEPRPRKTSKPAKQPPSEDSSSTSKSAATGHEIPTPSSDVVPEAAYNATQATTTSEGR
jgi:mitochondrial intermembrane space import and assembly protein 40